MFYIKGESGERWDFTCFSLSHEESGQTAAITVVTNPVLFFKMWRQKCWKKKRTFTSSKKKKSFCQTRTQTHARTLASSGCPTFVWRWLVPLYDANALCTSKGSLLRFGSPPGLQIRRLDARFCDLQYNYCSRVVAEAALNRGRGDCAVAKGKVSLQGTVGELNWGKGKELISLAGYNVPAGSE